MTTTPDPLTSSRGRGARPPHPAGRGNPEARMSIVDHIRELRNRLIKAILGLVSGMIVGWFVFRPVWAFLERPYCHIRIDGKTQCHGGFGHELAVTGVFDGFFLHLKIAFLVGFIISSPIWLYQLWAFIAPGLYRKERRWAYLFVGTAVPLFAVGAGIAYFALGRALGFLVSMIPNNVASVFTVDTYLGYVTAMLLIFGLTFELPLVMVMLNVAGVLSHAFVKKWRRVMIFLVFVFAGAAIPSPDPFSMLLLAGPCVLLVEVAEVFVWLNDRRRARAPSVFEEYEREEMSSVDGSSSGRGSGNGSGGGSGTDPD